MKNLKHILAVALILLVQVTAFGQDRFAEIQRNLNNLAANNPGLNQQVDFSINGASIQEFLRGIAKVHNLNIYIDPNLKGKVVNNFSNASVTNVLIFVCREYDLDITFTGSIMSFKKYVPPAEEPPLVVAKVPKVDYNSPKDFLTLTLDKDSLDDVVHEITKKSLKNVQLDPSARGTIVRSVYIMNRPFDSAIDILARSQGLLVEKTRDNVYFLKKNPALDVATTNGRNNGLNRTNDRRLNNGTTPAGAGNYFIEVDEETGMITVESNGDPISEIIAAVSREKHINYFLFKDLTETTQMYLENATYEQFLNHILNNTTSTYKVQDGVYLIGERKMEGLRTTELVQLENRTVDSVAAYIPEDMKADVDITEFIELNSLILSGSYPNIAEIKSFIRQIDQVVPMVLVEVMIVDVNRSKSISTGLSVGLGNPPQTNTGGTLNGGAGNTGGVNAFLNANTINNLINSFNGFGALNLGRVTQDFYVSLRALEADEVIKIRSTPKLSTLNGHQASMSIGQTEYYLQVNNNTNFGQTATVVSSQEFLNNNADLSIEITPVVSSSEYVTLDIVVEQSDFIGVSQPNAPRDQFNRSFSSKIRVQNGEMILMGGLEETSAGRTSTGLPLIARIPVLKWIFGTNSRSKEKSQLNIFIRPTIIY